MHTLIKTMTHFIENTIKQTTCNFYSLIYSIWLFFVRLLGWSEEISPRFLKHHQSSPTPSHCLHHVCEMTSSTIPVRASFHCSVRGLVHPVSIRSPVSWQFLPCNSPVLYFFTPTIADASETQLIWRSLFSLLPLAAQPFAGVLT